MSIIKFCALGGLGENGKNLYLTTIDDKIFIMDAGLKYPSVDLLGIDAVIPDMTYLYENKNNIQGLFLSHGHEENCGAIVELLKNISIPVFGSHFTISIVECALQEAGLDYTGYRLYRINDEKVLSFGNIKVSFFNTTHSIPESMGIAINTEDGAIVYAPDFSLSSTKDAKYQTSFDKISDIARKNVLLLCPESLGVNNVDRVNNDYIFNYTINEILQNSKRVIFSMFSHDLNRIQKVVDLCVKNNRRIAIIGRKVQRIVNVAMNTEYLKVPNENLVNLKFIDELNDNNQDDLAVIVAGVRHEPYFMIQRMITNQDKLIKIVDTDNVVIISPPVLGTEKIATRAKDQLSRIGCKVHSLSRNVLKSSHADGEDLMMLYQMLKPKYICPVIGEYRHQYVQKNIAVEAGYKEEQVVVIENGEQITFIDGQLQQAREKITVGDVLIDGSIVGDINEVVLHDRECLSEEGAVIVVTNIDSTKRRIISPPKLVSRGFGSQAQEEIEEDVINVAYQIINKELENRNIIDWNNLKNNLRDGIAYEIQSICRKSPIIIPVIIDVNGEDL